jgi:filamentous hemagglutinin family protein
MSRWRPIRTALLATTAIVPLGLAPAAANPLGPQVVGGAASVSGVGTSTVTVTQTTQNAIINWQQFNIGAGELTRFNQPNSSSIMLNRVTGGMGPSTIDGSLTANGRIFIINPNGMLIGRGAVIDTGGFLATTNDITNRDFMAGRFNFTIPGRPDASIVNQGVITAHNAGFAGLVAPGVRNSGTISATFGRIGLASANGFTLDLYGDQLITLTVNDSIAATVKDVATGQPLTSLVKNDGTLKANGGRVELTAVSARQVVDSVINNSGVIEARSIGQRSGKIVLGGPTASTKVAGAPTQTVKVSGTLSVAGKRKNTKGGTIQITGENIELAAATLDASGPAGGGKVLIGGDVGGGKGNALVASIPQAGLEAGPVPNATTVSVDSATVINASATGIGDAGKVIVWSDHTTTFAGLIKATGGATSGNGGFVEVSGHRLLNFTGGVDLRAQNGSVGTLLLDPENLTIMAGGSDTTTQMTNPGVGTGYFGNVDGSILTVATLQSALASGNVLVATGSTGNQAGDLTVASSFTWSTPTTLVLSAHRNIVINNGVTISNTYSGGSLAPILVLRADNGGTGTGTVTFLGGNVDMGPYGFTRIQYNPTGGFTNPTDYSNNVSGVFVAQMLVNNVTALQNMNQNLAGNYALGRDIDATATAGWNGGEGFAPIGNSLAAFSGSFDGDGRVVDGLTMNRSVAGLFGELGRTGIVQNVGLINVNITGQTVVGGLAAVNTGGAIFGTHVTGSVTGTGAGSVGGLVGQNSGLIAASYSNATVQGGSSSTAVGGLVGANIAGGIADSFAVGPVTSLAITPTGGLVGSTSGSVGFVSRSYASGAVSGAGVVGGLVGANTSSTVSLSFWDTQTTGQASSAGGTGITSAQARDQSTYTNWFVAGQFGNNWRMLDGQTRPFLGPVRPTINYQTGAIEIRNGYELQLMGLLPTSVFALARNIDLGSQLSNPSDIWGSAGFAPIAGIGGTFSGGLDGQGHTIAGLRMSGSASPLALFPFLGSTGVVANLNLTNVEITGTGNTMMIGALVGVNSGTISNVNVSGSVSGGAHSGVIAGGLVGQNEGTITASSSAANVAVGDGLNGSGFNYAGSLVGVNYATISYSSATGAVTAGNFSFAGGLVGLNGGSAASDATIASSSASGNVTGSYTVGGLAGANFVTATTTGTITGSSATGNVTLNAGGFAAGGLVGQNEGQIALSHYDTGTVTGSGASGAFANIGGLAGINMSFANNSPASITDSYANTSVTGTYVNAGGLVGFNDGAIIGTSPGQVAANTNVTIGGDFSVAGGLVGLNGANGVIRRATAAGSVGRIAGTADDVETTIGGLVGLNFGAIKHSTASTTVTGGFGSSGGLVGQNDGTIWRSSATGDVTASGGAIEASAVVGGLVGTNSGTIKRSFATGNVTGGSLFDLAGGLVGQNDGTISRAHATGTVTVGDTGIAGGLVGINFGSIDRAHAAGAVSGGLMTGGLVGLNEAGATIDASHATGAVAGAFTAGGLVGSNFGEITSSYATGAVTGLFTVGGLVGSNFGDITGSYATGAVTATGTEFPQVLGGLVGMNSGTIEASYATGNVSSASMFASLGGLVGLNLPGATISVSYATGNVTSTADLSTVGGGDCGLNGCQFVSAGGLVGQNFGTIEGPGSASQAGSTGSPKAESCVLGQTCATGTVTVGTLGIGGGLVGSNDGIIANTFATGNVTGAAGIAPLANSNHFNQTTLGGLVGFNTGLIGLSSASGNVGAQQVPYLQVGGLVGYNAGTILASSATGNVTAGNFSTAGGLVGSNSVLGFDCDQCFIGDGHNNNAAIASSSASGNVTVGSSSIAGGLVGFNNGVLVEVSASGNVTGGDNSFLGGLVGVAVQPVDDDAVVAASGSGSGPGGPVKDLGMTPGSITFASASGAVTSTGPSSVVGGLVGLGAVEISNSSASGAVVGTSDSFLGGFFGVNLGSISESHTLAGSSVTGTGANNVAGGFGGVNFGWVFDSTSVGNVSSGANSVVGGFVGANARYTNEEFFAGIIPGATTFPIGTIDNSTATGSATGGPGSTVGAQVGVTNPSTLPAYPSIIADCTGRICEILKTGKLPEPNEPAPDDDEVAAALVVNLLTSFPPPQQQEAVGTLIALTIPTDTSAQLGGAGNQPASGPGGRLPAGFVQTFAPPPVLRPVPGPDGERFSGLPPLNETRFFADEVVVQVPLNVPAADISRIAQQLGVTVISQTTLTSLGRIAIRFRITNGRSVRDIIRAWEANRITAIAQPNYRHVLAQPNDASRGDPSQYVLDKFRMGETHRLASGSNVTIAVVDSLVDTTHSELAGTISERYDAVGVSEDAHSHGTAMAGAIVSRDRLLGVAPSAKIVAVRSFAQSAATAEGTTFNILKGIEWAVNHGVRVINMSFAGPFDPSLERVLKAARDKGVVLVAAAGNAGPKSPPLFPGADINVIAVTATDSSDRLFRGANQGGYVSVAAPGVEILAPAPQSAYQMSTGTSIATAHVSGVIALMLERDPSLTPADVKRILETTATDLGPKGRDNQFGWGLVNPEKALAAVDARKKNPVAAPAAPAPARR